MVWYSVKSYGSEEASMQYEVYMMDATKADRRNFIVTLKHLHNMSVSFDEDSKICFLVSFSGQYIRYSRWNSDDFQKLRNCTDLHPEAPLTLTPVPAKKRSRDESDAGSVVARPTKKARHNPVTWWANVALPLVLVAQEADGFFLKPASPKTPKITEQAITFFLLQGYLLQANNDGKITLLKPMEVAGVQFATCLEKCSFIAYEWLKDVPSVIFNKKTQAQRIKPIITSLPSGTTKYWLKKTEVSMLVLKECEGLLYISLTGEGSAEDNSMWSDRVRSALRQVRHRGERFTVGVRDRNTPTPLVHKLYIDGLLNDFSLSDLLKAAGFQEAKGEQPLYCEDISRRGLQGGRFFSEPVESEGQSQTLIRASTSFRKG